MCSGQDGGEAADASLVMAGLVPAIHVLLLVDMSQVREPVFSFALEPDSAATPPLSRNEPSRTCT